MRFLSILIYVNAFLVGSVLMGFEMLASRYLFPYFGGGIGTWASLISIVLCALAIGYFAGGALADRYPTRKLIAAAILAAGAYLSLVPSTADAITSGILENVGDGAAATLLASAALMIVPMSLLGTYSPISVRLLIRELHHTGRVSGLVYGISTMGNVVGTLVTTFALIPSIGSRSITLLYAAVLAACALSLLLPIKEPARDAA